MKHKIIILSNWKMPMEKSWSGTTYHLTKALEQYYEVDIKNLSIGWILRTIQKLSRLPLVGVLFGFIYDKFLQIKANYILRKDRECPVFEICEDIEIKNQYFTYQDMTNKASLDVLDLKNKYPFIYHAAGNDILSLTEINRRISRQYREYIKSKAVFFMSHWVKDIMSKSYPDISEKIIHIGGGTNIDINKIDYTQKKGNKFLFIGRDFERKAGDLVIDAFKIVKNKYMPEAELHIAGCNIKIEQEGIFYYGDVDYDEIAKLLNRCDVFCMPSRFEAYGLVFIESLIYGLPCIGRKFFEMPYFIEEGKEGALIVDDNPEILAQKMFSVISDKEMAKRIQTNKDYYIAKYSWNSVAERAKNVINEVLNWN